MKNVVKSNNVYLLALDIFTDFSKIVNVPLLQLPCFFHLGSGREYLIGYKYGITI